jgi:hypothetical protein
MGGGDQTGRRVFENWVLLRRQIGDCVFPCRMIGKVGGCTSLDTNDQRTYWVWGFPIGSFKNLNSSAFQPVCKETNVYAMHQGAHIMFRLEVLLKSDKAKQVDRTTAFFLAE